MKVLCYDLEIAKCIPKKAKRGEEVKLDPSLKYCHGWVDHFGMGISALCAHQSWDDAYRVFDENSMSEFHEACDEADLLVSYNGIQFDNKVISAHSGPVDPIKCYDIRVVLLDARPDVRFEKGYNLDGLCSRTVGMSKSGDGALAPVMWQAGRIAEVIDYCLNDVRMLRALFEHIQSGGPVMDVNGGEMLLRRPSL